MARIKFGNVAADARNKVGGVVYTANTSGAVLRSKVTPCDPRTAKQRKQRAGLKALGTSPVEIQIVPPPGTGPGPGPGPGPPQTVSLDFCTGGSGGSVTFAPGPLEVQHFSLACWVKLCADNGRGTLFSNEVLGGGVVWFVNVPPTVGGGGRPLFGVSNVTNQANELAITELGLNVWRHVGVSWDGNLIKLFLDGVDDSGGQTGAGLTIHYGALQGILGSGPFAFPSSLNGQMCDFRFYNAVLADADFVELYNGGHILPTAGAQGASLLGWYKLGEGSGSIANDSSVSGNTGTVGGSFQWAFDVP